MDPFGLKRIRRRKKMQMQLFTTLLVVMNVLFIICFILFMADMRTYRALQIRDKKRDRKIHRLKNISRLIRDGNINCKNELRVNTQTFWVLCEMLRDVGGLVGTRNMPLEEIVAMFLFTLSHHRKNRIVGGYFFRSGESVSRQFNRCLLAVLKLHHHLLKRPNPIKEDCEDERWKMFKNCIGALDGTYISVRVPSEARGKYRTRKGHLAMNVLGACTPNMEFTYILPGWEGSAHDGRVLRNALSRPNGLRVPQGSYYLVDAGYTNCEGFLAPYRGHRYHLKEWGARQPQSAEEYFNMKHSKARNVIERCFGVLKGRWAILRSPSFFPIRTQGRIVMACALLHNLIRRNMATDDIGEEEGDEEYDEDDGSDDDDDDDGGEEIEYITHVASSDAWNAYRDNLAQSSFNGWRARIARRV